MCYFAHLGVRIVDDRRRFPHPTVFAAAIERCAEATGLPVEPSTPLRGSFLARALASFQLRFAFRVGHCACDWHSPEFEKVKQLTSRLLTAREVKSVTFLLYMIKGAVVESRPQRPDHPPPSFEMTYPEFSEEREMRDKVFVIRRATGEMPTASLRCLSEPLRG